MDTKDWITIGIAAITLLNGWCQFWVKERLFNKEIPANDPVLKLFKSRVGVTIIAFTALVSIASLWALAAQVTSPEPLDRMSCLWISSLTVAAVLNMVLVQALVTLRRLAELKGRIEDAKSEAIRHSYFR